MEFWGVEVKSGQPLEVNPGEGKVIHLSQACLGEIKSNKPSESVYLHINVSEKKLVLGTLHSERLPQQVFDLVFDQNFQLSHNWKNGSVYFYGYKVDQPTDEQDDFEDRDSEEEEEALRLPVIYGQHEAKQETKNEEASVVAKKKDGKQKVKIVEPEKNKKVDSDDSNSDSDDSMPDGSDDSDEDSSDSDDDSDEEEETPKKQQSEKKRPNESAIKTPSTNKKAKMSTPQKTDSKKPHVDTPHPSKKPANKSNQKSPASTSDGAHSCKSCNRNFKSDGALKSHNQAKHAIK